MRVDKKIKAGTSVTTGQDIGSFETDQKIFKTVAHITVIEKDILFNDQGSTHGTIRVDTTLKKPQRFTFDIRVKESRSIFGKQWMEIYSTLIKARKGDFTSVGVLEVID